MKDYNKVITFKILSGNPKKALGVFTDLVNRTNANRKTSGNGVAFVDLRVVAVSLVNALSDSYKTIKKEFQNNISEDKFLTLGFLTPRIQSYYDNNIHKDTHTTLKEREVADMRRQINLSNNRDPDHVSDRSQARKTTCDYCGHPTKNCFKNPDSDRLKGEPKTHSQRTTARDPNTGPKTSNGRKPFEPKGKKPCTICGKPNHDAKHCKSKELCDNCGKHGHLKHECTAEPCRTCGKYYYKSANHKYHNCGNNTTGAINHVANKAQLEAVDGYNWRSDDDYTKVTRTGRNK